jgi:hypothetical protein
MAKSEYEKLKESVEANIRIPVANSSLPLEILPAENTDMVELNEKFRLLIESRTLLFDEFSTLSKKRLEIYETLIDVFYASFYYNNSKQYIKDLSFRFGLYDIFNSEEFNNTISSFLDYITNNSGFFTEEKFRSYINYFTNKYNNMKDLLLNNTITITYNTTTDKIVINGMDVNIYEQGIYLILQFLAFISFKSVNASSASTYINGINILLQNLDYKNRSLSNNIFSAVKTDITNIKNNIKSFMLFQEFRATDKGYNENYIKDIKEKFTIYENTLTLFSPAAELTLEKLRRSKLYDFVFIQFEEINSTIIEYLDEVLVSIETINNFIETYSLFTSLPTDISDTFKASLNNINFRFNNFYISKNDTDFDYVGIDGTDNENYLDYNNFLIRSLNWISVNDTFTIFLLFFGIKMKEFEFNTNKISNYAILSLTNKRLIKSAEIKQVYSVNKEKEEMLSKEYGVKLTSNINSETLDPSIKTLFPESSFLDLLDISFILDINIVYTLPGTTGFTNGYKVYDIYEDKFYNFNNGSWVLIQSNNNLFPNNFYRLTRNIFTTLLESFLKNKGNLDSIIEQAVNIFSKRGSNLKNIYFEIILRKTFKRVLEFLDESAIPVTTINNNSVTIMRNYLSSNIDTLNTFILKEYKTVYNFFYNQEINIINTVLNDGDFKNFLI